MVRNSTNLPDSFNTGVLQDLMAKLHSDDMVIAIRAYASLSSIAQRSIAALSERSQPDLSKSCRQLASFPDRALSVICKAAELRSNADTGAVRKACHLLAQFIER